MRVAVWRRAGIGACLLGALCGAVSASASQAPPAAGTSAGTRTNGTDAELARLRAAHRASPGDPQGALELGLALFQRDNASLEAQRLLDVASRRLPDRHDVHLKLLESYLLRNDARAVTALLARLRPVIDSSERLAVDVAHCLLRHGARPDDPEQALELGLTLFQRDNASLEAQGLLDAASRRFPERHDVHLKLLESYLLRKNASSVTALLARLQPELDSSVRFAFDATYLLLQHRQLPLAQAQWQRVDARVRQMAQSGSQQAPEAAEAPFVQGLLATAAGDKAQAMQLFHSALSQGFAPSEAAQMLLLADSFYWLEEFRPAVEVYREVVRRVPGNVQARLRLGASLYWTSQLPEAREQLERVLRESPRQPEANLYLGLVLFALKRAGEAQERFETELALDPGCGLCMCKLGHLAYMAGDDRRAETWLEKAVAAGSASPEIDLVHGMIASRAGHYEVAIRRLSKAVERIPQFPQAQFQLATAYQRSGNAGKAQEHFALYRQLVAAQGTEPSESTQ